MWHVSFRSGVATLRTAIRLLLTYLLTYLLREVIDAGYCYRCRTSVVCVSVCLSVCWAQRYALLSLCLNCMIETPPEVDSGEPKQPCVSWRSTLAPHGEYDW